MDPNTHTSPGFITFLRTLLLTPSKFFRQYLAPGAPSPYWSALVVLLLTGPYLETLRNMGEAGDFDAIKSLEIRMTLFLVFGVAPLVGLSRYFLAAWLMKLIIRICGGEASVQQTRRIIVYNYLIGIIITLINFGYLLFPISNMGPWSETIVLLVAVLFFLFNAYQLYIMYCAFMEFSGIKKNRVIIFLLLIFFVQILQLFLNP